VTGAPHPTQVRRPWRSTIRTTLAALLALLPLLPTIADAADVDTVPTVAAVLGVTGAISRVLAAPGVETWLRRFLPPLAADPDTGKHEKETAR